jgi:hypothetical protein
LLLHDPYLSEPFQDITVHAAQPLFLKPLLTPSRLYGLLQMFAHKSDEVNLVHRV